MTGPDLLASVRISQVWLWLGGGELRHNRGRAFWRQGADNPTAVAVDDSKNIWIDHRDHRGGGVLDLIRHVRGGERGESLRWLAVQVGVELDGLVISKADRRRYARARDEGKAMVDWRAVLLFEFEESRRDWWKVLHFATRHVLVQLDIDPGWLDSEEADEWVDTAMRAEISVADLDRAIDTLMGATFKDLLPYFRRRVHGQRGH